MKTKAAISVITAGVLWGIISFFIKRLSAAGLDSLQITAVRMLISFPVFMLLPLLKKDVSLKIRLRDIWMFIGTGVVSIVLFNALYFYTMVNSQVSIAVVLLYTSPVFIMLLSAVIFKERITGKKVGALLLTLVGCALTAGIASGGALNITPAVLLTGLCAGFFYGLYTIFGQIALKRYDTLTVTAYTFLFAMLSSVPLCRPTEVIDICRNDPSVILYCIGVSVFCTVLPYFFYTWGLKSVEGSKAAILVAVEPLVASVIGMCYWHESHDIPKIIGIALIIGAIVLLNVKKDRK